MTIREVSVMQHIWVCDSCEADSRRGRDSRGGWTINGSALGWFVYTNGKDRDGPVPDGEDKRSVVMHLCPRCAEKALNEYARTHNMLPTAAGAS